MNREELELEREHLDLLDALDAAKHAYRAHGTEANKAKLTAAKDAVREFREKWRTVRDAFAAPPAKGDGVANPKTVKARVRKVS